MLTSIFLHPLQESCSHPSTGVLTLRLHVDGVTGSVREVQFLADTLVPLPSVDVDPAEVRAEVLVRVCMFCHMRFMPSSKCLLSGCNFRHHAFQLLHSL